MSETTPFRELVYNEGRRKDVRWLDWEADSELARALWTQWGGTYSDEEWKELWTGACADGYWHCAVVEGLIGLQCSSWGSTVGQ